MIDIIMDIVRQEVNTFITSRIKGDMTDIVLLSSVVDSDKKLAIPQTSIGLCLLNIEEERYLKENIVRRSVVDVGTSVTNPAVNLNLQVIFIANFKEYKIALQHISNVISFFQSKPVFTPQNTPVLGTNIPKLVFELNTLGLEHQHYIWSMIGISYLPSVVYKVRMVTIQESETIFGGGLITAVEQEVKCNV